MSLDQVPLGESEAVQGVAPSTWSSLWALQGEVQTVPVALGQCALGTCRRGGDFALRCPLYKVTRTLTTPAGSWPRTPLFPKQECNQLWRNQKRPAKMDVGQGGPLLRWPGGAHVLTEIGANALKRGL